MRWRVNTTFFAQHPDFGTRHLCRFIIQSSWGIEAA
jgi:hypothetical protein